MKELRKEIEKLREKRARLIAFGEGWRIKGELRSVERALKWAKEALRGAKIVGAV